MNLEKNIKKPGDWSITIKSLPENANKQLKRMILFLKILCGVIVSIEIILLTYLIIICT